MGYKFWNYGRWVDGDTFKLMNTNNEQVAWFKDNTGYAEWKGGDTAADSIRIYANTAESYARMDIEGNGSIAIYHYGSSKYFKLYYNSTHHGSWGGDATDTILYAIGDRNISLKPLGTGKLKYGTQNAIGAETVTHYLDALDSAGAAIKIALVS